MNLVLDAAEYETLRRVAFGDGDPTLPAFKEAVLHEFRTDEIRGISRLRHRGAARARPVPAATARL